MPWRRESSTSAFLQKKKKKDVQKWINDKYFIGNQIFQTTLSDIKNKLDISFYALEHLFWLLFFLDILFHWSLQGLSIIFINKKQIILFV